MRESESLVRKARTAERDATERRHSLELEKQEIIVSEREGREQRMERLHRDAEKEQDGVNRLPNRLGRRVPSDGANRRVRGRGGE